MPINPRNRIKLYVLIIIAPLWKLKKINKLFTFMIRYYFKGHEIMPFFFYIKAH